MSFNFKIPEYCNGFTRYSRFKTRIVNVGSVPLGGDYPIRVQSMTTTDTMDTLSTVNQAIRMIEAGCEYVRLTAPSIKEAQNLENIKKEIRKKGYNTPFIADIHYTPNAAELAARIVEKVRINPGNYADKKKFEAFDYSDSSYLEELERIKEKFTPLVTICKEYGTAMRIGTNHGSLSDRILSRYGDTPLGMVESALEFVRICEDLNYHNIVLSMKASNPQIMVQAYRLLVKKMRQESMNYPLHLGVTEAGEGEDGRIKSAVGIGTLLEDGLGDTIRVSLTEDPEFEIPVAKVLVNRYNNRKNINPIPDYPDKEIDFSPYELKRRKTISVLNMGDTNVPRVVADYSKFQKITPTSFSKVGYIYSEASDKWNLSEQACDFIFLGDTVIDFDIPGTLGLIYNFPVWQNITRNNIRSYPYFTADEFVAAKEKSDVLNFVHVTITEFLNKKIYSIAQPNVVFVFETENENAMAMLRRMFVELLNLNIQNPVVIQRKYNDKEELNIQLFASTDFGGLYLDGFGDGTWLSVTKNNNISQEMLNSTAFGILQATRSRISKTEYISCPSCGRTLFDLQETTAKIRLKTDHLKGIKIGIMGCIVNGPGEMADADYGYVGTGIGKITLYKGKNIVERNLDAEIAVEALIDLIKENGDWVERK